jgi:hypothetical protein
VYLVTAEYVIDPSVRRANERRWGGFIGVEVVEFTV